MSSFPGETVAEILNRAGPKLQSLISRQNREQAHARKVDYLLEAPTKDEILAVNPSHLFISVSDERNRLTYSFRVTDVSKYNFLDLDLVKIENGIYIGELHAKQTDEAGIPKKELLSVKLAHIFDYCRDLAILTTDKVWQGSKALPALQKSVKELSDPEPFPIPNKQIYLLIPNQKALLTILRMRAEEVALSEEDVQVAFAKHKQALEKNLTEYELKLYANARDWNF